MNIEFQYANRSNTSVLLKIDGVLNNQTVCLLVDAGKRVDVDSLIDEEDNEYLTGILLTHLHLDHYKTLGENLRDGARVYTSEENERLLETVLSEADSNRQGNFDTQAIRSAVTPVADSVTIGDSLTITPIPAGHTPGATAFYVELKTGGGTETILITGDFTRRKVAGYPGLSLYDTDTVVLTGATSDSFRNSVTDAVNDALEQGVAGSPTLVTASGLNCVHFAYLLGHTLEQASQSLQINIVGQAAKLYDGLGYDVPNVQAVQEYAPEDVVDAGYITVSGPDVPTDGGSKQLFDEIRDDPSAGLIQLISSDRDEIGDSRCTTNHHFLVNHPTMETIENTVEMLDPKQVVITHQTGPDLERYRDQFSTIVWAPKSNGIFSLYENGEWSPPPWVGRGVIQKFSNSSQAVSCPSVDPSSVTFERTDADLEAEGLNTDEVAYLSQRDSQDSKYSIADTSTHGSKSTMSGSNPTQATAEQLRADGAEKQPTTDHPGPDDGIRQKLTEMSSSIENIGSSIAGTADLQARAVHVDSETVVLEVNEDQDLPDVGELVTIQREVE